MPVAPTWEDTSPIESRVPQAEASGAPTWDNTFDPHEKYGTVGQQIKAGLEGFARGATLGGSDVVETKLFDVKPEDIKGRQEENPWTSGALQVGGAAGALALTGGLAAPVEAGLGGGAAARAAGMALEGGVFGAGNAVSEAVLGDPNLTAEKVLSDIGMGAAFGAGLGALSKVTEAAIPKATKSLKSGLNKLKGAVIGSEEAPGIAVKAASIPGSMVSGQSPQDWTKAFYEGASGKTPEAKIRDLSKTFQEIHDSAKTAANELFEATGEDYGQTIAEGIGTGRGAGSTENAGPVSAHARPLEGLPESSPGPTQEIRQASNDYLHQAGLPHQPQIEYTRVDPERAKQIATAYEEMPHDPNNPEVKKAYDALLKETNKQYQEVKRLGIKVDVIEPGMENPYPNGSADMINDVRNKHLWVFPTDSGFGTGFHPDHPLLAHTGQYIGDKELLANDVFRIVHDVFGHAKEGVGFGPHGEENAWLTHARMFSPEARKAMTAETRGQNSWVNYGPFGEANRANPELTTYAEQKAGLLPEEFSKIPKSAANSAYDMSLKNFQSAFMKREMGTSGARRFVVDPGKVKSFFNRIDDVSQDLRKQYLSDFIGNAENLAKASESYFGYQGVGETLSARVSGLAKKNRMLQDAARVLTKGASEPSEFPVPLVGGVLGYGAHAAGVSNPVIGTALGAAAMYKAIKNPYELGVSLENVFGKLHALSEISNNVASRVESGAQSIFSSSPVRGSSGLFVSDSSYNKRIKRVEELAGKDPTQLMDHLGESTSAFMDAAPNTAQAVQMKMVNALNFLSSKVPAPASKLPLSGDWQPSTAQKDNFNLYFQAVDDPTSALKSIKHGTLTGETMEALQAVHPQLLEQMQMAVMSSMDPKKIKNLSYGTKISLSKFLGQPLDESLLPQVIQSNQISLSGPQLGDQVAPKLSRTRSLGGLKQLKGNERAAPNTRKTDDDG